MLKLRMLFSDYRQRLPESFNDTIHCISRHCYYVIAINNMAFNDYRAFPSHLTLHNCLHFQFTYPYFMFVCIVHDKPRSCPLLV